MYQAVLVFCLVLVHKGLCDLDTGRVEKFAKNVSDELIELYTNHTDYTTLLSDYSSTTVTVAPVSADETHFDDILERMRDKVNKEMQRRKKDLLEIARKVASVEREDTYQIDGFDEERNLSVYLEWYTDLENKVFIDVFVPVVKMNLEETQVDIDWANEVFQKDDLFKRQQVSEGTPEGIRYFLGTSNGVLRFSPEQTWPKKYDMYDSRLQSWFLEAASSQHDLAIMIDRSGSVYGITLKTMAGIARLLVKTIPSNFRFNVFLFNDVVKPIKECFGFDPLQGNERVKSAFLSELLDVQAGNRSNFNKALKNVTEKFFKVNESNDYDPHNRMVVLFTDGMLDFDVGQLEERIRANHLNLLVLDFASPVSPGPNKQLEKMSCDTGGHYVFVKDTGSWFEVADKFYETVAAIAVSSLDPIKGKVRWSQPTVTYNSDTDKIHKSIILSHPVFSKGNNNYTLTGVLGTDILVKEFMSNYSLDAGSLAYGVITLPDGKVINHPRLPSAQIVPTLKQAEGEYSSTFLYPLPYLTDAPITKRSKLSPSKEFSEGEINDIKYQLVIPENDAYDIGMPKVVSTDHDLKDESRLNWSEILHVRPFPNEGYNKQRVIQCVEDTANCRPAVLLTLAQDIILSIPTVVNWAEPNGTISKDNFLMTRSGALFSTISEEKLEMYQSPIARKIPEFLEFSADPDKFDKNLLLVLKPFGTHVHLAKSISVPKSGDDPSKVVLSVMGTRVEQKSINSLIDKAIENYDLDMEFWELYLLDHRGNVVLSNQKHEGSRFFGGINCAVWWKLVEKKYFTNREFQDCICAEKVQPTSPAYRISFFVKDFIVRLFALAMSAVVQSFMYIGQSLAFIMPEPDTNFSDCCRDIFSYDRNFKTTATTKDTFPCLNDTGTDFPGNYIATPVPDTNLLLVLVQPHGHQTQACRCETPATRVGNVTSLSQCDMNSAYAALNKDIYYNQTGRRKQIAKDMEKICKDKFNT